MQCIDMDSHSMGQCNHAVCNLALDNLRKDPEILDEKEGNRRNWDIRQNSQQNSNHQILLWLYIQVSGYNYTRTQHTRTQVQCTGLAAA